MDNQHPLFSRLESRYVLFASLALIALFYLGTLVDGQNWSGDFSHYIHHAKNLVEGKHYLDTHYLLNSYGVFVGPYAYPPIFPLLLVPFIWLAGADIEVLKLVGNIFFVASLWLAMQCFKPRLRLSLLLVLLITAFNPYIWSFRNNVLSDFPFTFFCFLTLYLSMRYFQQEEKSPFTLTQSISWAALIGVCCYLCFGTREIGVVTPLTFLTYDIVCRRRISVASLVMGGTFVALAILQTKLLSGSFVSQQIHENLNALANRSDAVEISHLEWVSLDPELIVQRIFGYRYAIQDFWITFMGQKHGVEAFFNKLSFNLTTLLAVAGYLRCLIRKITVLEIFIAGYIAVLLLFGAPPTLRYLIPLFPLFIYYAFLGIQSLELLIPRKFCSGIALGYFLLTFLAFTWQLPNVPYERLEKGIYNPQTQELFDYVINNTNEDDTFVFRKPRVLAFFTNRLSAAYPNQHHQTRENLEDYFDAIEGDYYIDMELEDWMLPLKDSQPPTPRFEKVFSNTYFAVYRYTPQN